MKIFAITTFVLGSLAASDPAIAQAAEGAGEHWFYMVRSKPADPAREAEYNAWYDDIDIPDVLAVPGFLRARRAVAQDVPGIANPTVPEGRYAALYDIETDNIDKSIIDLYVAARKMAALGRLTDVLKVVEANYYRRVGTLRHRSGETPPGDASYFYLLKIACCKTATAQEQFRDFYRDTYTAAAVEIAGVRSLDLYELYRVMEVLAVPSEEIPHLLIVHELAGDSAPQAARRLGELNKRLRTPADAGSGYVPFEAVLYRQMSDVHAD